MAKQSHCTILYEYWNKALGFGVFSGWQKCVVKYTMEFSASMTNDKIYFECRCEEIVNS